MNSLTKALTKKVGNVVDRGGSFIAKKVMLQPSLDVARGKMADKQRMNIIRKRESRQNDKAMGY